MVTILDFGKKIFEIDNRIVRRRGFVLKIKGNQEIHRKLN